MAVAAPSGSLLALISGVGLLIIGIIHLVVGVTGILLLAFAIAASVVPAGLALALLVAIALVVPTLPEAAATALCRTANLDPLLIALIVILGQSNKLEFRVSSLSLLPSLGLALSLGLFVLGLGFLGLFVVLRLVEELLFGRWLCRRVVTVSWPVLAFLAISVPVSLSLLLLMMVLGMGLHQLDMNLRRVLFQCPGADRLLEGSQELGVLQHLSEHHLSLIKRVMGVCGREDAVIGVSDLDLVVLRE